ncbi:hypothetical protein PMI13_00562 [Chryseobacterium populi]|uniref:Uncharacterized protein n=1 Tax=Chryseobacterium populi TaxID=1144316 RepID=J2KPW0_9FLAO|nr:hypothetical protein PMI13_00562 [Chryseobacterium populi]
MFNNFKGKTTNRLTLIFGEKDKISKKKSSKAGA